jgi:hypothetical protein
MLKENITNELFQNWQKRLLEITKTGKFEINTLDNYIK